MNTALVLNSIAEAEDFLARREEFPDPALFSTCSSVDEFLGRRHGLKCLCLSSLLPSELASSNIIRARRMARELTEGLDRVLAADFCAAFGVAPMRLFQALYSYMAYNQCIIYLGLRRALDAVVGQGVEELLSYDRPIADFLSCATTLERFYAPLSRVPMRGLRQAAVGCAPDPTRRRQDFPLPPGLRLERLVKGLRRRLGMGTSPVPDSGSDGPAVLLLEPLYDLEFLKEALADLALVSSNSLTRAQGKMPTPASSFPDPAAIADLADNLANGSDNDPDNQAIARRVVQDLAEDFAAHLPEHAAGLAALERLRRERGLALGVWGNSPVRGFRALAAEYLLANGVEVLGAQHGGLLGNRFNDDVHLSDLSRCTDYVSYGLTEEDLSRTFPGERFEGTLHPLGCAKITAAPCKGRTLDVIFPLTITSSIFWGGLIRERPDLITAKQVGLLGILNALPGARVLVKPFMSSTRDTLAALPVLEQCRGLRMSLDMPFSKVMEHFRVRSMVIEHMSTALYEALPYDTEIFALTDSVRPLEPVSLALLQKRVRIYDDVETLGAELREFLAGRLEPRRDQGFLEHFVHKPRARENIADLARRLAAAGAAQQGASA